MTKRREPTDYSSPLFLVLASVISVLLWVVPPDWPIQWPFGLTLGSIILYPFRIFVTFVHEAGHALTSILTQGSVDRVIVHPNASGETHTRGGVEILIASAGYLTSCGYGSLLLSLSRRGRNAEKLLFLNALLVLAITVCFLGDLISFFLGFVLAAALFLAGMTGSAFCHLFLNILSVQCCLNAILDLVTLLRATTILAQPHNDAMIMEQLTSIPAPAWAISWTLASLLLFIIGLIVYTRNGRR